MSLELSSGVELDLLGITCWNSAEPVNQLKQLNPLVPFVLCLLSRLYPL